MVGAGACGRAGVARRHLFRLRATENQSKKGERFSIRLRCRGALRAPKSSSVTDRRYISIPIVLRVVRASGRHAEVAELFLREPGQFHADAVEVQAGDFFVELPRQAIDADVVRGAIGPEVQLRTPLERLSPALPPEASTAAVDELIRDRSAK